MWLLHPKDSTTLATLHPLTALHAMPCALLHHGPAMAACAELTAVALAAAAALCSTAALQQLLPLLNKCLDALLQEQAQPCTGLSTAFRTDLSTQL
jgi:hypothetical protein